jgi:GntR family transcriptional regulator/MocR family aminotransferase
LRRAIADYLARRRGLICDANDIVIVSGTQQAMTLVTRVLLNEGDRAVVEDPFYQLAVQVLIAHGARISYVRTDMEGLCVGEIPDGPSRLAIVTPSHQFPSGVVMSTSRRIELLHWACKAGAWIMEDDYDSEFHGGARPLPTLRSLDMAERVIYVGTFSKTLFPGLRLGYIVAPSELLDDFVVAKRLDDVGSSVLEQMALATFMQSGLYERQLRRSVREVVVRRHALVEALRRRFRDQVEIGPHSAGMHLVLWFPNLSHERLAAGLARASAAGVSVQMLRPHCHAPPKWPGILLGYAALSATQIRSGVEVLWESLRSL